MNPLALIGAFIITLSLLAYGIGTITLQRFKLITPGVVWFISLGVFLDISATVFMIFGSSGTLFTTHAFVGFTAIFIMMVKLFLLWKKYISDGKDTKADKKLITFSKLAYAAWVLAYLMGSFLIIWKQ